jgi:hypothetical protein
MPACWRRSKSSRTNRHKPPKAKVSTLQTKMLSPYPETRAPAGPEAKSLDISKKSKTLLFLKKKKQKDFCS